MKKLLLVVVVALISVNSYSQFGIQNKIKNHYKQKGKDIGKEHAKKAEDEGMKHAEDAEQEGMKHAMEGVNKLEAWSDPYYGEVEMFVDNNLIEASDVQWQKLAFVRGKDLIFYDKPFNYENKRKEPSKWLFDKKSNGEVNVDELDQGKSILVAGKGYLSPKVENPGEDYLPDNFTFEFDFMMPVTPYAKPISVYFYGIETKNSEFQPIVINKNIVSYKDSLSRYPVMALDDNGLPNWYRLSVSFDKGLINVYLNERKMITYQDDINPTGITIDYYAITPVFFKNFILAKDQKPVVDQINDGEYISFNIDYLINDSKLSGTSLAELSKVAVVLIKNPEMKLDIDVYFSQSKKEKENKEYGMMKTDAISQTLISMGVDEGQIMTKFKGSIISSDINPKNYLSEAVVFKKR